MIRLKHTLVLVALSAGGCGPQAPAPSNPGEVVRRFMDAVNDENLSLMGQTWGTGDGPAANWMEADELRKRLSIMQNFLVHAEYEIAPGAPAVTSGGRLIISVRLVTPNQCESTVPFTVVPYGGGWLVESVDLNAVRPTQVCG